MSDFRIWKGEIAVIDSTTIVVSELPTESGVPPDDTRHWS